MRLETILNYILVVQNYRNRIGYEKRNTKG